jgi:hypothetical protein
MKRKILIPLILVLVLSALSFALVAAQDAAATVYVGHGIPGPDGLPVDVLLDDTTCLLEGFTFGQFSDPQEVMSDTYNIKISPAVTETPCSGAPVIDVDLAFEGDVNYTVFAHLTASGTLTATLFTNDVSDAVAGYTRLTVRHTAYAPAVDIPLYRGWIKGRMITKIEGLENPNQAGPLEIRPGAYAAAIIPAGGEEPVFGPFQVELEPHKSYIVYAVGGLPDTFTLLTQVIDLGITLPPRPELPIP